jgi:hypothetical protein
MSENLLGVFPKLIPWTIHSKHNNITKEIFRLKFAMEILLGTNTGNFSHGIIPTFYWVFS